MTMKRGLLLVKSGGDEAVAEWQAGFYAVAPELEVRGWNDPSVDSDAVTYVLVWEPEPGRIAGYRNLRAVFSSAAGVDHIVRDPTVPAHLPIVRMVSEEASQTLGEYCCLAALSILRDIRGCTPHMPRGGGTRSSHRTRRGTSAWGSWASARSARSPRACWAGWGSSLPAGRAATRAFTGSECSPAIASWRRSWDAAISW